MAISRREFLTGMLLTGAALYITGAFPGGEEADAAGFPYRLTDAEWRKKLTPGQYAVLRRASGPYL